MVIGISTDPLERQAEFTKKEKLNFPLFADAEKKAAREFGVLSPRGFATRATFVIDKQGAVRKVFNPVTNSVKHPDDVLKYIKENLAEKK